MAAETAPPPVAYERLKDIASGACDSALKSVSKYDHASTESWNTTIINTILPALVSETTSPDAAQPQYKYIVNSLIIQHAASSGNGAATSSSTSPSQEGKVSTGRRGMHSASGAYWNNAKDGMWSFKYEAAEAKGLDVVVGITWIWVG